MAVVSRHPPPSVASPVLRPKLFARLDAGVDGTLTVLTGAPGSGKTQLLTTWLDARSKPGPVVWMSLEFAEGHPVRFWSEFAELVGAAAGRPLSDLPGAAEPGFEAALARACEELSAPVVVVLDSFEQLRSRRITESLDRFLRTASTRLHLVIASRRDPGLSLQRLRLAGQLTDLRSADLAFTCEQARELFELAGARLNDDQVRTLWRRTEGWVAGLRLAALSLVGRPDPEQFVQDFAGDERTVGDYLVEEVLHQQPVAVREFMLRTSVVDELEPELANALTGGDDGAQTLSLLERANAFVTPLDDRRQRYRYQAMLLELLRSQLSYQMPDAFALQHRRAARWYAAHGRPADAVRHAVAAGDDVATAEMLGSHWLTFIVHGHGGRLAEWIDRLSEQAVVASPEVAVAAAGAALSADDLERAAGYLALADRAPRVVAPKRRARYALSRATAAMLEARARGDYGAARSAAREVLAGHGRLDLPDEMRAVAFLHLGVAECWSMAPSGPLQLERALELARRASYGLVVVDCLSQLALFAVLGGGLTDGLGLGNTAVSVAIDKRCDEHPVVAAAHLALAIAQLNRADLAGADEQLRRAECAIEPDRGRVNRCLVDLFRAQLTAQADPGEATTLARVAAQKCARWQLPPILAASAAFFEAVFAARSGQAERAQAAWSRDGLARTAPVEHAIVVGRLALAAGQPVEALRRLDSEQVRGARALHPCTRIEAVALSAVCKHQLHDDVGALTLVEQALELAQPEDYRLPLLNVGSPLRDLLKRRIRAGTSHRALAGELIDALDGRGGEVCSTVVDALSKREEAVLRYLPTVMSKAEIASELAVSVNTVKTHTKNIYRKLDVGTRTDAVRRARAQNLL